LSIQKVPRLHTHFKNVINIHQFNEAVNKDRYNNFYNRNKGTNVSLITDSYGIPLSIECYRGNMNDCRVLTNHLTKQEVIDIPIIRFYVFAKN
jgi:hypothetical protein